MSLTELRMTTILWWQVLREGLAPGTPKGKKQDFKRASPPIKTKVKSLGKWNKGARVDPKVMLAPRKKICIPLTYGIVGFYPRSKSCALLLNETDLIIQLNPKFWSPPGIWLSQGLQGEVHTVQVTVLKQKGLSSVAGTFLASAQTVMITRLETISSHSLKVRCCSRTVRLLLLYSLREQYFVTLGKM